MTKESLDHFGVIERRKGGKVERETGLEKRSTRRRRPAAVESFT